MTWKKLCFYGWLEAWWSNNSILKCHQQTSWQENNPNVQIIDHYSHHWFYPQLFADWHWNSYHNDQIINSCTLNTFKHISCFSLIFNFTHFMQTLHTVLYILYNLFLIKSVVSHWKHLNAKLKPPNKLLNPHVGKRPLLVISNDG